MNTTVVDAVRSRWGGRFGVLFISSDEQFRYISDPEDIPEYLRKHVAKLCVSPELIPVIGLTNPPVMGFVRRMDL